MTSPYPKSTQSQLRATRGHRVALKVGLAKATDSHHRRHIAAFIAEMVIKSPERMEDLISAGEIDCHMARKILEAAGG